MRVAAAGISRGLRPRTARGAAPPDPHETEDPWHSWTAPAGRARSSPRAGGCAGSGGEYDAVEPATGTTLARVGAATAADVHKAAEAAAQAQRDWAALPYDRRAAVLRRAGQLFVEHEDEIHEWLIRESGAIRPFAGFQTRPSPPRSAGRPPRWPAHPYGELLRSNQPRLSMARRLPGRASSG